MNIKEIRRINLERAIEIAGGSAKLAGMIGTAQAYLSQILNPQHKASVGDKLASRIEEALDLPVNWMSVEHVDDVSAEREQVLLSMYRCLNEDQQLNFLQAIKETKLHNDKIVEHYRKIGRS